MLKRNHRHGIQRSERGRFFQDATIGVQNAFTVDTDGTETVQELQSSLIIVYHKKHLEAAARIEAQEPSRQCNKHVR